MFRVAEESGQPLQSDGQQDAQQEAPYGVALENGRLREKVVFFEDWFRFLEATPTYEKK